ncbi:MAG: rhodanese-like domain-containing protein [Myxococcaceae bacterium]
MEPSITPNDLFLRLGDDELLVVDCREEDEWNTFGLHIPGALRMNVQEISESIQVLPDDELIVLCGSADGSEARRAYRLLSVAGREVVCLLGGLTAWVTGGFPTERHRRRVNDEGLQAFAEGP